MVIAPRGRGRQLAAGIASASGVWLLLLPAHQGGGNGRRLIEIFVQAVTRAGAVGLHVAVSPTNTRAHGFYLRVGFERLHITGGEAFFYGLKTPAT